VFRVVTLNCKQLNLTHNTSLKACKNISDNNRFLKKQESLIDPSSPYPNCNTPPNSSPPQAGWREAKQTGKNQFYSVIISYREL
jgi:hypothetical protein